MENPWKFHWNTYREIFGNIFETFWKFYIPPPKKEKRKKGWEWFSEPLPYTFIKKKAKSTQGILKAFQERPLFGFVQLAWI